MNTFVPCNLVIASEADYQFIKVPVSLLKNSMVSNGASLIWGLIDNRFRSNLNNPLFFDKKWQSAYAPFTLQELCSLTGIKSLNTITKLLRQLVDAGYLVRKKGFNSNYKYVPVMPRETAIIKNEQNVNTVPCSQKMGIGKSQKMGTNKNSLNNKTTSNTDNTPTPTINNKQTATRTPSKTQKNLAMEALKSSLQTKAGLNKRLVDQLSTLSFGDPNLLREHASLIFKAKNYVKQDALKQFKHSHRTLDETAFNFEMNPELMVALNDSATRILLNAHKKAGHNWQGYAFHSFITEIQMATNSYLQRNSRAQSAVFLS